MAKNLSDRTIEDFGRQWTLHPVNDGYYASPEMFKDICGPLLDPSDVAGANVADLGSGTGRIVLMLLNAGAATVTAVEPSDAFGPLGDNTAAYGDRVSGSHGTADQLSGGPYDLIVSIGVLHHIPDPAPVVKRAFDELRPGGRFLAWVYGAEGNGLYLALVRPMRILTMHLPDALLALLCHGLTAMLGVYVALCRLLPLPMRAYVLRVLGPYGWRHRYLTVFDQLNPAYAKYYTGPEGRRLLERAGFEGVSLFHRHGYSWTLSGRKPRT